MLDRFRNPAIEHRWLSICAQYTAKLKMRVLPALLQYQQRTGQVPALMALGFAAHALFMRGGNGYTITDEHAGWYAEQWKLRSPEVLIKTAFGNQAIWGLDLNTIPGFAQLVTTMLKALMEQGVAAYLEKVAAEITVS